MSFDNSRNTSFPRSMNSTDSPHKFHIPVMGTSYTIDTPIRIAHFGVNSVVSLIDHRLIEMMREVHSETRGLKFEPIDEREDDAKARRITAYLNLIKDIVHENTETLRNESFDPSSSLSKWFELLPETSELKAKYRRMRELGDAAPAELCNELRAAVRSGAIDVNIMTKVDSVTYDAHGVPLPVEYNDAHASLRGFANSRVNSSLVLSAGLNPRLYSYIAHFDDFFFNEQGVLNKKIILKVSDYRSALIQGKFLAKKGLWISEFRVESGLNCGGHAFATDGYLLGPIMQEFHDKRYELREELFSVMSAALTTMGKPVPTELPSQRLTVQGGVGTTQEQQFLIDQYGVDSVGWGTPFLLCPEAVCIDDDTIEMLCAAKENDLYLSGISPLGVPFNSVRGNTAQKEVEMRVLAGKPGAACIKKHLVSNQEYGNKPMCTASIRYQRTKLDELKSGELPIDDREMKIETLQEKTCLCVGLANAAYTVFKRDLYKNAHGIAVCPGPNMAYYNRKVTFREMVDHIYGRINIIERSDRPHMFVKELGLYIEYLKKTIRNLGEEPSAQAIKGAEAFRQHLEEGIEYYRQLFHSSDLCRSFFGSDACSAIAAKFEEGLHQLRELSISAQQAQLV